MPINSADTATAGHQQARHDGWVSIVILTALDVEARAFKAILDDWTAVPGKRPHFRGRVGDRIVVVYPMAAAGNVNAAVATRYAIAVWNPEAIILAGIAGGMRDRNIELGDVLVPQQVVATEPGKLRTEAFESRYEVYRASNDLLRTAHFAEGEAWWNLIPRKLSKKRPGPPSVHWGVVASGEKVIADSKWSKEINKKWPRTIGVEMEAIGVAHASYDGGTPWIMVKAVSDYADDSKNDDWHTYAAASAAAFVAQLITNLGPPPNQPPSQPQIRDSPLSTEATDTQKSGWGKVKVALCRNMSPEEASDLADYFEVPAYEIPELKSFGSLCKGIWVWLEKRKKLSELPDMLVQSINRPDLRELVLDYCSNG